MRRSGPASAGGAPALAGVGSRYMTDRYGGPPYGGSAAAQMPHWQPYLREPQADTQEAWLAATAETIQAMHTSGNMAGAIKSARGQIMFENGLRPNLKPWGGMISSDPKVQAAWARDVEGRFMVWANNPWNVDLGGRHTFGVLLGQLLDQRFATGEMVMTMPHIDRPGSTHGIKVNVMPSQRLSQLGGTNTVQGVTMDPATGAPVAYNFNNYNMATHSLEQKVVAARDGTGRPVVVHVFDNAPGTVRGITPFAPVLRVLHASDQLGTGQLVLSLMQNIFAATVESPLPSAEILMALMGLDEQEDNDDSEASRRLATLTDSGQKVVQGSFMDLLTAREKWYNSTNIDLGKFGKIAHLFPGEKLTFNRPNAPSADYVAFQKFLHYECARALGIAAFQWNGIFDGYTYTTAKMAIDEAWPMTLWNRQMVARVAQAVFMAWLEEDIILGNTALPGGIQQFYAARDFVCRCDWIGPPRPTADDLKTAKAMQVMRAEGWQSSASIASGYGYDWTEEADDQHEFNSYRDDKELDRPPSLGGGGNGAGSAAQAGPGGQQSDDGVDKQTDREARLVGAMLRGDNAGVEAVLMENENDRQHFGRFAARAASDFGFSLAA